MIEFPLLRILRHEDGRVECECGGNAGCRGKHPAIAEWQKVDNGWVHQPGQPYGIPTGSRNGIWVLDIDLNKPGGSEWYGKYAQMLGDTLVIRTGSGGFHYYYLWTEEVRNSTSAIHKGIDTRGEGGYVVGPGSEHLSGDFYEIAHQATISPAPEWLMQKLRQKGIAGKRDASVPINKSPDAQPLSDKVIEYAKQCPPAVAGEGGHTSLFMFLRELMYGYSISEEDTMRLFLDHYNPRCQPPWDLEDPADAREIAHKFSDVRSNVRKLPNKDFSQGHSLDLSKNARKTVPKEASPKEIPDGEEWVYDNSLFSHPTITSKDSERCQRVTDLMNLMNDPAWAGVFYYDTIRRKKCAYHPPERLPWHETGEGLYSTDITTIRMWLEHHAMIATKEQVIEFTEELCMANPINPIKDYFDHLPKVNSTYFENPALTLFGAPDPLVNSLVKKFFVGAVRRGLKPGTKHDMMLIITDPKQGSQKGRMLKAMFEVDRRGRDGLFSDATISLRNEDEAIRHIRSLWAIEIPEVDHYFNTDKDRLKGFITKEYDDVRDKYQREPTRYPRSCSFIGTSNHSDVLPADPTGQRRYVVVEAKDMITAEAVREIRDAFWAEALVYALDESYSHWLTPEEIKIINEHNNQHEVGGYDETRAREYLKGKKWIRLKGFWFFVCQHGLGNPGDIQKNQKACKDLAVILRKLGCTGGKEKTTKYGIRDRWWTVPEEFYSQQISKEAGCHEDFPNLYDAPTGRPNDQITDEADFEYHPELN